MLAQLPIEVRKILRSRVATDSITQCILELVFNSLDAEATSIKVYIDMKKFKILVTDNGTGLRKNQLEIVCQRYVTNKCHSLAELERPSQYYGYRGETLANIRSVVDELIIISRDIYLGQTYSKAFYNTFSKPVKLSKQHLKSGTVIILKNIFMNFHIRHKMIKEKSEMNYIRTYVEAISVIHPSVSFLVYDKSNEKVTFERQRTGGLATSFTLLFNKFMVNSLVPINAERPPFKINGYICMELLTTNKYQLIYINKRYVLKTTIHHIINEMLMNSKILNFNENRYETYLSHLPGVKKSKAKYENYLAYILNIQCPYTECNINFNATKTQIEFQNWDNLLKCLNMALGTTFGTGNFLKKCPDHLAKYYHIQNKFVIANNKYLNDRAMNEYFKKSCVLYSGSVKRFQQVSSSNNLTRHYQETSPSYQHKTKEHHQKFKTSHQHNLCSLFMPLTGKQKVIKYLIGIKSCPELVETFFNKSDLISSSQNYKKLISIDEQLKYHSLMPLIKGNYSIDSFPTLNIINSLEPICHNKVSANQFNIKKEIDRVTEKMRIHLSFSHKENRQKNESDDLKECSNKLKRKMLTFDNKINVGQHIKRVFRYNQDSKKRKKVSDVGNVSINERTGMSSYPAIIKDNNFIMSSRDSYIPKGYINNDIKFTWISETNKIDNKIVNEETNILSLFNNQIIPKGLPMAPESLIKCVDIDTHTFKKDIFNNLNIIGQIDCKYIAAISINKYDDRDEKSFLLLFDQHAVDERIRLERLISQYSDGKGNLHKTNLEAPLKLKLQPDLIKQITLCRINLENLGLTIDSITNKHINIISIPKYLLKFFKNKVDKYKKYFLQKMICMMIKEQKNHSISLGNATSVLNTVNDLFSTEACSGAVKFGKILLLSECKELITNLSNCQVPFQCAHGRPLLTPIIFMKSQETEVLMPTLYNLKKRR